jgi:hypothetical protein
MPLPWNSKSITELLASLENIIFLVSVLFSFFYFKNKTSLETDFLWFLVFTVLSVFFIVGFTTPVAGAIVRYKMPVIPFLLMIAVFFYAGKTSEN